MRPSRIITATLMVGVIGVGASGIESHPTPAPRSQSIKAVPLSRRTPHQAKRLLLPGGGNDASSSSSSSAAAASSSSLAASSSSSSLAAASSASSAAAISSSAALASSSLSSASAASAASKSSESLAASQSSSLASAQASLNSAASASRASSYSSYLATVQTVVTQTQAQTPSASANADTGKTGTSYTGLIIGLAVAGGVVVIAALIFLWVKFGNKRFSGYDDYDNEIKWPELKADNDGTGAAMQPLPARRTGGAGFDMGDEGSDDGQHGELNEKYAGRNSFTGSTTALSSAAPNGYPVNAYDAPSSMAHSGYTQPQGYYDPNAGYGSNQGAGYADYGASAYAHGSDPQAQHYAAGAGNETAGGAYADQAGYADQGAYGAGGAQYAHDHPPQAQGPGYMDPHYTQDVNMGHGFTDPYGRTHSPPQGHMVDPYGQRM